MGIVTIIISYICLIGAFVFIIIILSSQLKRLYKSSDYESFYSIISSVIVLIISLFLFIYFKLIAVSPTDVLISIIVSIIFLFFIGYNIAVLIYNRLRKRKGQIEKGIKEQKNNTISRFNYHEFLRKSFHFLIFGGIIAFLFISISVLSYLYENSHDILIYELMTNFWGPNPRDPLNHYEVLTKVAPSSVFLLSFFLVSSIIIVMNEGARLTGWFNFPLSKAASLFLREKEVNTFASYLFFVIGMTFSSLILSTFPILSILATLSFGDSSYALIGKRFGRHKIPFNKIKSIEGSIGGFIITFIATTLFVGYIYGLLATIIFTVIDVITPRIPMCDNIMGPIFITIGYILLNLSGIPLYSITLLFV
ncbi:MAG: hypothetical protein ACTSPY_16210 [Candidatus Helarchaeota archaeon]